MVTVNTVCMIKGCEAPAEFYMRRVKRSGEVQAGLVCDHHEQQYAEENLKKLGGEVAE